MVGALRLRDDLEGAEDLFCVEWVRAASESHRQVGLGDDPDDGAVLVNDWDPADTVGTHEVLDILDVVFRVAAHDAAAHDVTDPHLVGAQLRGKDPDGEIAVGEDPDDPLRTWVRHGEGAAIGLGHEFGSDGDGVFGGAATWVRGHELASLEYGNPIDVGRWQGRMESGDPTARADGRRARGARLHAIRRGEYILRLHDSCSSEERAVGTGRGKNTQDTGRLRVGLAQVNATVGDLGGNVARIGDWIDEAREAGADLVIFPELSIPGYPPEDLLLRPSFLSACRRALEEVAERTRGITALVGFPHLDGDLYNAAAVLHDGEIAGIYHKQRLPTYAVFDELRYFRAGSGELMVQIRGAWVGISICEEIWVPGGPIERLALAGADVIVSMTASPYDRGKWRRRQRMIATRAADYCVAVAFVNQVGGQDELVFDGNSLVFGPRGELLVEGRMFEEDLVLCDIDVAEIVRARLHDPRLRHVPRPSPEGIERIVLESGEMPSRDALPGRDPVRHDDIGEVYSALLLGIRDYVRKNGFERVVLGLSGGIDSALVAALAVDALGRDAVVGVSLPSRYTSEASRSDAEAVAKALGIELLELPIEHVFTAALETLAPVFEGRQPDLTEENLQARIRGMLLMALSNKFGWLLLTTGNKSEFATGYTTLYGDMAGGFAVLKDVPKTLVRALAIWRNARDGEPDSDAPIPRHTIEKPPSAELRPDQYDTDSLPPYDVLDPILERYVEQDWSIPEIIAEGHDPDLVRRVARLVDVSEYKRRQSPPGVKITERAFGKDRRVPITSRFRNE